MTVAEAYHVCRATARREARNFFYAFLALPEAKRDAICAVYAFMRFADDLSDDEALPHTARSANLAKWLADWHDAAAGQATDDPVFVALNDARNRFGIPLALLDQLVEGTAMDLYRPSPVSDHIDTYATFEELYRYCYLVASVVGLVCIRIFGYTDPAAEHLAEELGVGFQLTNILRDVREDAERGRVYLPLEDLARYGTGYKDVTSGKTRVSDALRATLSFEAERAERYYQSGTALLALIAPDSRPALWVLMRIYHRLLERIRARRFEVLSERVRVSTGEKLWILARGLGKAVGMRLAGTRAA